MVHLTFNGTERRKMPSPLKIGLFTRYHSETPCKVCLETVCSISRTPEQIERGPYHAITPEPVGAAMHNINRNRYRAIRSEQPCKVLHSQSSGDRYRPEPEPTDEQRRPNQPGTITPNRSSLSRSALPGFFAALRSGELTAGSMLPCLSCQRSAFCGFLRIFQPNCTKYVFVETYKTRKTAHLLAFCKHAEFPTNLATVF